MPARQSVFSGDRLETYGKGNTPHVKTLFAVVLILGLAAVSGFAQPTVTLVVNAASSSYPPVTSPDCKCSALQNSGIARGSYFTIYGNNFGPSTSTCNADISSCYWKPYPLPTSILGTSAKVTVGTTTLPVYLEFAEQLNGYSQINAVLPSNTPSGDGTITVTYNGATSNAFPITVADSSFGTFTWNEAGSGPGIFTNAVNYNLITPFSTIKPGQYVTIWGTGLGPVSDATAEQNGAPAAVNLCSSASTCPVTVWVAGQKANVTYAGRSGYTAEDQIDFVVPPGVQGCYVQVAVQTGSIISNFTSMAADPNGATCSDTDGIHYNDLATLVSSKGSANIGGIILFSNYLNVTTALGSEQWDNDTVAAEIGTFNTRALESFQGFTLSPSVNNCTVTPFLQLPPAADSGLGLVTPLDAGASLTIKSPAGSSATVPKNTSAYGAQPAGNLNTQTGLVGGLTLNDLVTGCPAGTANNCAPFFLSSTFGFNPGTYTVSGSGGAAVGAFSAPVSVSSAAASFKWTNQSTVTANPIPRNTPLTITWTGGDPNGFVNITAIASTLLSGAEPQANTPGVLVECIAPASTQSFTIPTYVLQSLPSTINSTAFLPPGELLVGPTSGAMPITPLPSGLDALYATYHFIQGQNVNWQ